MGQIYKHTSPVGKSYIGRTKYTWQERAGYNPAANYSGKFRAAILKYGWDNFTHEVVEEIDDDAQLPACELFWIQFFDTVKTGYNLVCVGYDPSYKEELGRINTIEVCDKYVNDGFSVREMVEYFNLGWVELKQILLDNGVEPRVDRGYRSPRQIKRTEDNKFHPKLRVCAREDCDRLFLAKLDRVRYCSKSCCGKEGAAAVKNRSFVFWSTASSTRPKTGLKMKSNRNGVGNGGGKKTAHIRWHVQRNKIVDDCEFCSATEGFPALLSSLTDKEFMALHDVEGLTGVEIARRYNVSTAAVSLRIRKIRQTGTLPPT